MSSPTSRTLEFERKQGYTVQVVEYWHAFSRRRVDLFNCIDVISLTENKIKGIQCTSRSNHSARENKAKGIPAMVDWLRCGGMFEVQSWGKNSKKKWIHKITRGYLDDKDKLNFREIIGSGNETAISKATSTQSTVVADTKSETISN